MSLITANSVLFNDKPKLQAVEVLMHVLQYQTVASVGQGSGESAAQYCAEFIEELAKRLKKMAAEQT
jgi:fructoselysine-6-P-deglycase FrlB-like protein